jgi:hypothetical protein
MERAVGILVAICALGLIPARASTMYSISPATISASPGDAGDSFDVVLTNNGPGSISVAAFAFEVTVADPDVTLIGATYSTALPYIFPADDSFDQINATLIESLCSCSYPLSSTNIDTTNQTLVASDVTNDGAGFTITSGESIGLAHVLFDVAFGSALGPVDLSFTGHASGVVADSNNMSDPSANLISVDDYSGGTISISSSSIPEPSSLSLTLAGMVALMAAVFLSRRDGGRRAPWPPPHQSARR